VPENSILVSGDKPAAVGLEAKLRESGFEPRAVSAGPLAHSLGALERELQGTRHSAALAVGRGDGALALAITAGKLGVPLAALLDSAEAQTDEGRAIATLASLGVAAEPEAVASLIAGRQSEKPSDRNLD
jgi:hypothetical protein